MLFRTSIDTFNVDFLVKSIDINKLQRLLENDLKELNYKYKEISRISIIGCGITNDNTILDKIMTIIKYFDTNIFCVDITNAKIIVTFYNVVENELLKKIHNCLF